MSTAIRVLRRGPTSPDAPARRANIRRNAGAEIERPRRWQSARDALWQLVASRVCAATRVAIVGAGNADDVPLTRLAAHGRQVILIDLDGHASTHARRREPRALRRTITVIEHDITDGAADKIAAAAARGIVPEPPLIPEGPLPGAPYDLVIGDLLYSQLLYPAMLDTELPDRRICAFLNRYDPQLTRGVVARLHASAPGRPVVHLHDPLAWWPGHPQPLPIETILGTAASESPEAAARLAARGRGPRESDPRHALAALDIPIYATHLWRWPFAHRVNYLVCATVAQTTTPNTHHLAQAATPAPADAADEHQTR